jgi:photosystem II stability/assembly factor-like uncharacterized protein
MRYFLAISLALVTLTASANEPQRHPGDATLRSTFFIDQKEGWVVGDEGVILHTLNGGQTWQRQATGLRSSLRSVHFLTPDVGWVVGREELPYGMGSVGVVLFTNNGGLEWKQQLAKVLPGLNQIRFVDPKTGFMFGDGSDQFPFGAFKTIDSGRTWEPIAGPRTTSWLAGDFYDGRTGMLVGAFSRLATIRKGTSAFEQKATSSLIGAFSQLPSLRKDKTALAEQTDWLGGRDITSLQILGQKTIAVGQGGLVLSTVSGGSSWGLPQKILAAEVQASLDFNSICAVKNRIWIVGRPGSVVVSSSDAGATWTLQKTGQALPLQSVFFFDERNGWAVGDAGTILHSSDGGKNWSIQQQAGQRAAAMTIHSLNKNAPVDTLTLLGAADGYLTTSLRVSAPDVKAASRGRLLDARRYAAAMRSAGALTGETLWQFPMPQYLEGGDKKTILAHWNAIHANAADEELLRQLVLSLRMWRPSVIIGEHPDSKVAVSSLVGEAVQEAVRRAADDKAFPEQLAELGLKAWTVRKIYGVGDGKTPTLTQDNHATRDNLHGTVRDYAATAHGLLTDRFTWLPKQRSHDLLVGGAKNAVERHWLEGLDHKVGESRREIKLNDGVDVKTMQAVRERRAAIDMAENLDDPERTLKLVAVALDKLDDDNAAVAAFSIAGRYAERGQWFFAQEVYLYLVDRSPAHPLSAEAYRWLIRLNTSSEARRRHEVKNFTGAEPIALTKKKGTPLTKEEIVKAGHIVPVGKAAVKISDVRDWNKGSVELMKRLSGFGPVYGFDPRGQFALHAGKRQLGEFGASQKFMTDFRRFVPSGPWHDAAHAELWLTDRSLVTPPGIARSRYTEVRPFLDGKFDDPCWKDTKPLVLDNAVGDTTKAYATEAMFAYDQEFLYIALKCKHPAGQQVAPLLKRARDENLDAFDRVSILLDLDRDYATYYHLEVDQRGCLRDSCWGDRRWNPRWFVAVHSTEDCWQIEAAIPLTELAREPITQQTAWAFNVVRVIPGRGVQSWSQPADVEPIPEGMSLLLFQTGKARPMPTAK